MKSNIFIPKKIKVGFQNRSDTYTKKLAYVIYYDEKGVLRKERSWEGWRDNKIESVEFDNVPTSGFVLNKKTGGYSTGWNHRQTYVRVYDSRDFEFEISVPNLLYILENTNSIKGKGLEGEFVYGWDGTDLVLIPVDSPDYKEISEYNKVIHGNNGVKTKDLVIGGTYRTKQNEDWTYMGKFDYYKEEYAGCRTVNGFNKSIYKNVNKGKYHYFVREYTPDWSDTPYMNKIIIKSLGNRFIDVVSTECVENYAFLFDKLECTTDYSPLDESKDEYIQFTLEELTDRIDRFKYSGSSLCIYSNDTEYEIGKVFKDGLPTGKYYYRPAGGFDYYNKTEGTLEEIFNKLQPKYKNEYLKNGKLYRSGK